MKLYIARHGQSEADLINVVESRADYDLTGLGREQAEKLSSMLSGFAPFDAIYVSPLKRAQSTAQIVCSKLGCEFQNDDRLAEFNAGGMCGMPREEAYAKYPMPEGGFRDHQKIGGETGESTIEIEFRLKQFIYETMEKHINDTVLLVTHGNAGTRLLSILLGSKARFRTSDCGLHCLNLDWDSVSVLFLNRTAC